MECRQKKTGSSIGWTWAWGQKAGLWCAVGWLSLPVWGQSASPLPSVPSEGDRGNRPVARSFGMDRPTGVNIASSTTSSAPEEKRSSDRKPVSFEPLDDTTFRLLYLPAISPPEDGDGHVMTFVVTGDLRGKLGPCGCPKLKMGGLAWRKGFEAQMERISGHPVHELDFGGSLSSGGQTDVLSLAQAEYVLRVLRASGVRAMNLAARDLPVVKLLMKLEERSSGRPFSASSPAAVAVGDGEVTPDSGEGSALERVLPVTGKLVASLLSEAGGKVPEGLLSDLLVAGPSGLVPGDSVLEGLVSANLRHARIPVWRVIESSGRRYFITGLTELQATTRVVAEGDFEVLDPEEGLRRALQQKPAGAPADGHVILVWGGTGLAERVARVMAELSPDAPALIMYGNGKEGAELKVLEEGTQVVFPMYREGKIAGIGHMFGKRVVGLPVILTDQFAPPAASPAYRWKVVEASGESFREHLIREIFGRDGVGKQP